MEVHSVFGSGFNAALCHGTLLALCAQIIAQQAAPDLEVNQDYSRQDE